MNNTIELMWLKNDQVEKEPKSPNLIHWMATPVTVPAQYGDEKSTNQDLTLPGEMHVKTGAKITSWYFTEST